MQKFVRQAAYERGHSLTAAAMLHGGGLAHGQGSGRCHPCGGIVTAGSSASPGCSQLLRLSAINHSGCMAALHVATGCLAHYCMAAISMIAGICPYMDLVCTLQGLVIGLQAAMSSHCVQAVILRCSQACSLCNNGRCGHASLLKNCLNDHDVALQPHAGH